MLRTFASTSIGPVCLGLIQRKGGQGSGEGNLRALSESTGLDQLRRGVLRPAGQRAASRFKQARR